MGEATCSTVRGVRPADRLAPDPYQCKTLTRVPFGADCGTETPVSMIAMGGISLF